MYGPVAHWPGLTASRHVCRMIPNAEGVIDRVERALQSSRTAIVRGIAILIGCAILLIVADQVQTSACKLLSPPAIAVSIPRRCRRIASMTLAILQ